MNIQRLHHAQITVTPAQQDAARAFYCDVMGLEEIEKPDSLKSRGGFWLALAGQEIHVSLEPVWDKQQTKAHLAYLVSDLEGWRTRLESRGIKIGDSVPIPGYNRFEFRDPFGNRVEFIEAVAD